MKLINRTTGKIISHNLIVAGNIAEKTIGLLNKPKGTSIFFKTRWGIHTFGMKYPITVVILNNQMEVVKIKKSIQPNCVFFWNPKFGNVIELSLLTLKQINQNDRLFIQA